MSVQTDYYIPQLKKAGEQISRQAAEIARLTAEVQQWTANSRENKLIAEQCERRHDDFVVRANANVCELNRDIARLTAERDAAIVRAAKLENERDVMRAALTEIGDMGPHTAAWSAQTVARVTLNQQIEDSK